MSSKLGRVYIFKEIKSNGDVEILKIGKSSDKSGLNGTLGFYINALSGTSGTNRFCFKRYNMDYDSLNYDDFLKIILMKIKNLIIFIKI